MYEKKLAYLAGVIDCDGFITIQRTKKNKKLPSGNICVGVYYSLKVGIAGTDDRIHKFAKELFGGNISKYTPQNDKHLPQYQWNISNRLAKKFLNEIYPFLIIKREQAVLGIDFQTMAEEQWIEIKRSQKPPYKITEQMRISRNYIWEKVVKLNKSRKRLRSDTNKNRVSYPSQAEQRKNNKKANIILPDLWVGEVCLSGM